MKVIKTSDLRKLDVIDVEQGRYLGSVCDVDLNPDNGQINAFIVDEARPFRFFAPTRHTDLEIPGGTSCW